MPTSELSDALNPHVVQTRSRPSNASPLYSDSLQPVIQRPQQYVPHRSELELAISEPPPQAAAPPSSPHNTVARSRNVNSGGVHAVQELLRLLTSTKEAQEIERKRRVAWEQEQEAKYALKQAEMERRMLEMRQEIASLKSVIGTHGPTSSFTTPSNSAAVSQSSFSPPTVEQQPTPSTSPRPTPVSVTNSSFQAHLASVSSAQPSTSRFQSVHPDDNVSEANAMELHALSPSFSPPARFISVDPSSSRQGGASSARKRQTPASDEEESSDSSSGTPPVRPLKRRSHHDTRCLTIQHAMRNHILRVMQVESDKELPDSHPEGTSLGSNDPVRFVWDKTPKQSVHNGRMKARVLKDLKINRTLYKHVPDKEFNKKSLDSVFDQAFVTLRQKFKAQRDASIAQIQRQREDAKSMKARRLSRKKGKLTNRSEARNRLEAFEHITFDGAFQVECMSSEESEAEEDALGNRSIFLRVRGFPWRSTRLQRFFDMLDEEETFDKTLKPKRGTGRKERCAGPMKDGFLLPPKGVANWMISRRWMNQMRISQCDVLDLLRDAVIDPPGFDWNQFRALGDESEDEIQNHMGHASGMQDSAQLYNLHSEITTSTPTTLSSSSLHNALAPIS
ncbi:hypothetical protein SERLA73DRAFT_190145 [Serpula lacrymans var. lacrymans S7.3]|uniref:Uncharacterized protein n=2 Tax=Serpula lacrymans var. lacrymans TaxID=341189 RepID=F8QF55_SERL3|nr:uncharacterized protein SERLADRAFT_461993 [Serpula lacrymans var. lacrymans S7.9]EGN93014.1 hypothetical protein SERLA73DRAFT_190145 [Serpula lacrymans var. lacrymans S7.3]EGO27854.1 hypothetical protein SERLADRAFT_461993 [Serpula lacrymans var. lacrymans S7.9]